MQIELAAVLMPNVGKYRPQFLFPLLWYFQEIILKEVSEAPFCFDWGTGKKNRDNFFRLL